MEESSNAILQIRKLRSGAVSHCLQGSQLGRVSASHVILHALTVRIHFQVVRAFVIITDIYVRFCFVFFFTAMP